MQGIDDSTTEVSRVLCSFELRSPALQHFQRSVKAFVLPKLLETVPSSGSQSDVRKGYPDPILVDDLPENIRIDLVIALDVIPSILVKEIRASSIDDVSSIETVFGWMVAGTLSGSPTQKVISTFAFRTSLDASLTRF